MAQYPQRHKIDQHTLANILKYFTRFRGTGTEAQQRQHMIDAYQRRQARKQLNLDMSKPRDVQRALRLHLLHQQPHPYGQNGELGLPPGPQRLAPGVPPEEADPTSPPVDPRPVRMTHPLGLPTDEVVEPRDTGLPREMPGGPDQGRPNMASPNSPYRPGMTSVPVFGAAAEKVPASALAALLGAPKARRKPLGRF